MNITVESSPHLDACTITHESVHLEGPEDVEHWRQLVMAHLQDEVGSRRVYLLVDFSGFTVSPAMADEYGKVAQQVRERFALDVFRYGAKDPLSAVSARLQSMKRAQSSNLYPTREEAIRALNRARGQ